MPDTSTTPEPSAPKSVVILIRSKKGTLHALLNPRVGDGVLAEFEDFEQASNAALSIPACQNNPYFLIPVQ